MPQYYWRAVDTAQNEYTGIEYAQSIDDLKHQLLLRHRLLVQATEREWWWWQKRISRQGIIDIFSHMKTLLDAGLLLPDILLILAEQAREPYAAHCLYDCAYQVQAGETLYNSLGCYSDHFDPFIIQMILVGHRSGSLAKSCGLIVHTLTLQKNSYYTLMRAAAVPLITFLFFAVVCALICWFVVPSLEQIFKTMGQQLPPATARLIALCSWIRSWHTAHLFLGLIIGILSVIWWLMRTVPGNAAWDYVRMRIPVYGPIERALISEMYVRSIGMLMEGGVPVSQACLIAYYTVQNGIYRAHCEAISERVQSGEQLSQALIHERGILSSNDIIAMIRIGEHAGKLAPVLLECADQYHTQAVSRIDRFILLFQPIILVLLGSMIAGVLWVLYAPLMSIASLVGR